MARQSEGVDPAKQDEGIPPLRTLDELSSIAFWKELLSSLSYLHVAFLTVVMATASVRFFPENLLFRLQPSFVGLTYIGFLIALLLWFRQPQLPRWAPLFQAQVLLMLGVYLVAAVVSLIQGSLFYFTAYTYPFFLLLILLKPLSRSQVMSAIDLLAWALLLLFVMTYLVDVVALLVGGSYEAFRTDLGGDRNWNPVHGLLNIDGRWIGPIGHPNTSGPIAAFLVVYSASRIASRLPMFAISGYLLLATGSISSALAASIGLSVLLAVHLLQASYSRRWRMAFAGLFVVILGAGLSAILISNPTFTGRTTIWPAYLRLGREQNLMGSGDPPIAAYVANGDLPDWAGHAHNFFLDMLARYGFVAFLLLLALFVLLFYSSVVAARRGFSLALGLLVTVVVANMTEVGIDPRYWEFGTVAIVCVALLAATAQQDSPGESQSVQSSEESMT